MLKYILKRILTFIPILIGVSFISFSIMHIAPGDPTALFTDPNVKAEELMRVRANWGLDRPFLVQYFYWISNAVRGDFGTAYLVNRPVIEVIAERIPATLLLTGTAMGLSLLIAIPLGVISAAKKNKFADHLITVFSFTGMSIPSFWLALILMLIFSLQLKLLPATGINDPLLKSSAFLPVLLDTARHMVLPVVTLVIVSFAGMTRFVRASMLEVLGQNYIRAARAKGIPERTVFYKHALRNALLPIITLLGMMLPEIISGAFIVETIFAWPGMGRLGVTAVFSRNYPVIMGVVMISAVLIMLGNLIADVCYSLADPRVRIGNNAK